MANRIKKLLSPLARRLYKYCYGYIPAQPELPEAMLKITSLELKVDTIEAVRTYRKELIQSLPKDIIKRDICSDMARQLDNYIELGITEGYTDDIVRGKLKVLRGRSNG